LSLLFLCQHPFFRIFVELNFVGFYELDIILSLINIELIKIRLGSFTVVKDILQLNLLANIVVIELGAIYGFLLRIELTYLAKVLR